MDVYIYIYTYTYATIYMYIHLCIGRHICISNSKSTYTSFAGISPRFQMSPWSWLPAILQNAGEGLPGLYGSPAASKSHSIASIRVWNWDGYR